MGEQLSKSTNTTMVTRKVINERESSEFEVIADCAISTVTEHLQDTDARNVDRQNPAEGNGDQDHLEIEIVETENAEAVEEPNDDAKLGDSQQDETQNSEAQVGDKNIEAQNLEQNIEAQNVDKNIEAQNLEQNIKAQNLETNSEAQNVEQNAESDNVEQNIKDENLEKNIEAQNFEQNSESDNVEQNIETQYLEKNIEAHGVQATEKKHENLEDSPKTSVCADEELSTPPDESHSPAGPPTSEEDETFRPQCLLPPTPSIVVTSPTGEDTFFSFSPPKIPQ